jgi:hypothetical protein
MARLADGKKAEGRFNVLFISALARSLNEAAKAKMKDVKTPSEKLLQTRTAP